MLGLGAGGGAMGSVTRDVDAKRLLRGEGGTEFKSGAMPKNPELDMGIGLDLYFDLRGDQ